MVMMSSTLKGRVVKFQSAALGPRDVEVMSLDGREAISTPFRFDVELLSRMVDIDSAAILQAPAYVAIKQGVELSGARRGIRTLKIHGAVSLFEQCDQGMGWTMYRAALVPRAWKLSLTFQSRVFLDKTVPQIVEDVLKGAGFAPDDYELRLSGSYPKREYVVQYQESDLNFVSRLLEHDGIFYFFEHDDDRDKIVFGDAPSAFQPVPGASTFAYRPLGPGPQATWDWFGEETVRSWTMRHQPVPTKVVVKDYNYRTPSVDLKSEAEVPAVGEGTFYEYGDHYKDQGDGKRYAKTRAEEIKSREKIFTALGDVRSFRAGATFDLSGHYRPDFNANYLITEVRHKTKQSVELAGAGTKATASYENEALCLPADVVFRPARVTPKPKIVGTMHAKVDASGDGQYAEVDDEGRYKVILPFDLSGRDGGKASRYIRMAQPYTGPDYGIHFPLHKKSEVILTHIDGDPDRPIIASAVPNPETSSPVKGGNQSQCVLQTGGGNKLVIEDGEGSENMTLYSPHAGTKMSMGGPGSGFFWETAADWMAKITGFHEINVDGEKKEIIKGAVNEIYQGTKDEHVSGHRREFTFGANSEVNLAVKTEITVGGIVELTQAVRLVQEGGWQFTLGPGVTEKNPVRVKEAAAEKQLIGALKKNVGQLMEDVGSHNQKIGTLAAVIGKLGQNIGKLDQKIGDVNQQLGKWNLTSGPVHWEVGPLHIKSAKIGLQSGGPCNLQGSTIALDASSIELAGDATCNKKLTVDGKLTATGQVDLG